MEGRRDDVEALAAQAAWSAQPEHALRVAASTYWSAGTGTRLWDGDRRFLPFDPGIVDILGG